MISTKRARQCERSIKRHLDAANEGDVVWGLPLDELISHRGYGSTNPLPEFDDGKNHPENRRVEMRLLEPGEEGYRSAFSKVEGQPESGAAPKKASKRSKNPPPSNKARKDRPTAEPKGLLSQGAAASALPKRREAAPKKQTHPIWEDAARQRQATQSKAHPGRRNLRDGGTIDAKGRIMPAVSQPTSLAAEMQGLYAYADVQPQPKPETHEWRQPSPAHEASRPRPPDVHKLRRSLSSAHMVSSLSVYAKSSRQPKAPPPRIAPLLTSAAAFVVRASSAPARRQVNADGRLPSPLAAERRRSSRRGVTRRWWPFCLPVALPFYREPTIPEENASRFLRGAR